MGKSHEKPVEQNERQTDHRVVKVNCEKIENGECESTPHASFSSLRNSLFTIHNSISLFAVYSLAVDPLVSASGVPGMLWAPE